MEIYVYGTGCGAGELTRETLHPEQIAAFVESAPSRETFLGRPVISLAELAGKTVDLLIVTAKDAPVFDLPTETVLYLKNHLTLQDRNRSYDAAREVLGDAFVDRLQQQEVLVRAPLWDDGGHAVSGDWVRYKTLEAICRELNSVPGAMAELGVFRGEFAAAMNTLLPERRLYLFDTFTGFDPAEDAPEGLAEAHNNASAELVLRRLPNPEMASAIVKAVNDAVGAFNRSLLMMFGEVADLLGGKEEMRLTAKGFTRGIVVSVGKSPCFITMFPLIGNNKTTEESVAFVTAKIAAIGESRTKFYQAVAAEHARQEKLRSISEKRVALDEELKAMAM